MKLYVDSQFVSPYALSAYVALRVKGLAFEEAVVNLVPEQLQAADYRARSLTCRVPTLVDGDFSLSESSAISEYLEDRYPAVPLYPRDARQRARARQVQAWLRSDLAALREERTTEVVFLGARRPPLGAAAAAAAGKLLRVAADLLGDGRRELCGAWTIADVDLGLMLNRLVLHGDPVPAGLEHYARRQWEQAAVQEWVNKPR